MGAWQHLVRVVGFLIEKMSRPPPPSWWRVPRHFWRLACGQSGYHVPTRSWTSYRCRAHGLRGAFLLAVSSCPQAQCAVRQGRCTPPSACPLRRTLPSEPTSTTRWRSSRTRTLGPAAAAQRVGILDLGHDEIVRPTEMSTLISSMVSKDQEAARRAWAMRQAPPARCAARSALWRRRAEGRLRLSAA